MTRTEYIKYVMNDKLRAFVKNAPDNVMTFVTSPKFAALLGLGVAIFQLANAVDQFNETAKSKKKIGFTK